MRTQANASKLATKLAASADPTRNTNAAEAASAFAKLVQLCFVHGFDVATFAPYYVAEPAPQPEPTEQPNASDAKRSARRAMLASARDTARTYYSGASLAAHRTVPPTLADCIARVADPVQRAKSVSERDESGLALALSVTNDSGAFDPVACGFDLGILSRLASLGHVSHDSDGFALTSTGLSLARGVVSRKR